MRWRRFLCWFFLSVLISTGCVQSTPVRQPSDAVPTETVTSSLLPDESTAEPPTEPPAPVELPAATQELLASLGPDGLFDPPRGDVRLVVISDLNGPYGSTDYPPEVDKGMALIPFWQPDMVVCSGDMVAGQDLTLSDEQLRAMWTAFDEHVGAPLRNLNLPYGFTLGNHDASSAIGVGGSFLFQRERDRTDEYWEDPAHAPGIEFVDRYDFPFYYTFKLDDIFFLSWDGSSNYIPPERLAWIEDALSSEAAQSAKLRIVLGHLPLYAVSIGRNQPADVMNNANDLRALLEKYNVHTHISGHHHAYYPGHKGNLQLLHMGILGGGPRPLIGGDLAPRKTMTVLDVNYDDSELTTYTTYDMQTLDLIENEQLPRFLAGHNGMVVRRDVDREELTAQK